MIKCNWENQGINNALSLEGEWKTALIGNEILFILFYGINHEAESKRYSGLLLKESALANVYIQTQQVNIIFGVVITFFIITALFTLEIL